MTRGHSREAAKLSEMRAKKLRGPAKAIAERFKRAREAAGITQTNLAASAGVDQGALAKFEGGGRGFETGNLLAVLRAASDAGINVEEYVLNGRGEPLKGQLIVSEEPLVNDVLASAGRLRAAIEKRRQQDSAPRKSPGPGNKRDKV